MQMESETESRARRIVESVLAVTLIPLDEGGGSHQSADYLIPFEDGPRVPLEVTASANENELGTHGARQKRPWSTSGLRYDWHLSIVPSSFKVRRFHTRRSEILARLEELDIDELDVRDSAGRRNRKHPR